MQTVSVATAEDALNKAKAHYPNHRAVRSADYAFTCPVSHPVDGENRAAHGNITRVETCSCCAVRRININQTHEEVGQWEYEQLYQQLNSARAAARQAKADEEIVKAVGAKIVGKCLDSIRVTIGDGEAKWISHRELKAAANQPDDGDGLVPFYGALYRIALRELSK